MLSWIFCKTQSSKPFQPFINSLFLSTLFSSATSLIQVWWQKQQKGIIFLASFSSTYSQFNHNLHINITSGKGMLLSREEIRELDLQYASNWLQMGSLWCSQPEMRRGVLKLLRNSKTLLTLAMSFFINLMLQIQKV